MQLPSDFREIINLWPNRASLARDLQKLGEAQKAPPVRQWHRDNRIPPAWFDPLLKAAEARGFTEVTYRLLAEIYKGHDGG